MGWMLHVWVVVYLLAAPQVQLMAMHGHMMCYSTTSEIVQHWSAIASVENFNLCLLPTHWNNKTTCKRLYYISYSRTTKQLTRRLGRSVAISFLTIFLQHHTSQVNALKTLSSMQYTLTYQTAQQYATMSLPYSVISGSGTLEAHKWPSLANSIVV